MSGKNGNGDSEQPTAILRIDGDGAMIHTIRDRLNSHLRFTLANTGEQLPKMDLANRCIYVYGEVTEQQLIEFQGKFNDKKYTFDLEYIGVKKEVDDDLEGTPEKTKQFIYHLQNMVSGLEAKVGSLEGKNKELTERNITLNKEAEYAVELTVKVDELEGQIADRNTSVKKIESEKIDLERKLNSSQVASTNTCDIDVSLILSRMAIYADNLAELEQYFGDDIYNIKGEALEDIKNSLKLIYPTFDIPKNITTTNQLHKYLTELGYGKNNEIEILLQAEFKIGNKKLSQEYSRADNDIKELSKQIGITKKTKLSQEMKNALIESLNKNIEECKDKVEEYEKKSKEFIEKGKEKISQFLSELTENVKITKLHEKVEEYFCKNFPALLLFSEDQENYNLKVYVPLKTGTRSRLCDILLLDTIFSASVRKLIKEEDYDNLDQKKDDNFGIYYIELNLPKNNYKLNSVIK